MNKTLSPTQKITFSAMLIALAVLSTFIAKTINMGGFSFLRFSLTPALVIYTSLTLGPVYGAIVGASADLIPAFTYSQGEYNFLITIVYVILGILPWLLEKITRHFRTFLKKPLCLLWVWHGLFGIIVAIFYGNELARYEVLAKPRIGARPTILAIVFALDVGLCVGLYYNQ